MAGVLFDVDATDFVTASTTSSSAAESAVAARGSLQSALSGSSSMAGSDPTGQKWSESYDSAAADAVRGLDSIVTVLGSVSAGLAVTGYNYASADWQSAGQAGSPPGFTVPSLPSAVCSAPPPSSSGGTRASDIPGFEYVADFIGTMWPDGDTGKLTAAASAWTALADSLDTIKSSDLTRVVDGLDGTDTPEMPSIRDTISQVQTAVGQLATEARSIATGCTDFAAQIESVHTQTRQELNNLLFQIEATVGASLLLTVVTAGASDVVGAGVVAGEVTFTVSRILTIIGEAAATVARVVDEVAVAAGSIARIAGISEQVTVRVVAFAGKSVVAGVGNSALNTVSTAITMPGADLNEAALSGFIGGAAFGTLGQGVKYGVDAVAGSERFAVVTANRSGHTLRKNFFEKTYPQSVHNPDADKALLGKFEGLTNPASYHMRAGTDHTYFSLGEQWGKITKSKKITDDDMFDLYNTRFLDEQIAARKPIVFSHNPMDYRGTMLFQELQHLESHGYVFDKATLMAYPVG
ncbi:MULTISPECIES: methyl-accepting chemotaxis protein [unclassified Frondihabitans]|uniref:WXG100-like domain-containing protein n=1 Tax=unclassified Frondihabitans TaxID=2626248 RepID=UPI000F4D3140|nr:MULTISPECIES: methyl-accepting chemotaxis protein [unclassified Frondihabitans]RPE75244.1 hypothetical protein EDF37_2850 [Frondihabitans sp. PhB153]RPF04486.1 hypothetical protein EDF39_2918 [Frondihabitans sp. PhB161]